jgi:hypothetical protein
LAVPPVIPLIHDELSLSATQIGILTGLPSPASASAPPWWSASVSLQSPARCAAPCRTSPGSMP